MNITHVVENLNRGGLERMVLELVKLQHQQGQHCQVVCLFESGSLAHELADLDIPVIACGKRRGLDLRALLRARRAVAAHATEVLHTHNAVAHYYAVLASCRLRLRYVINTRHGMGGNDRAGRREWLYRRALMRTNIVATVCEAARDDAVARGIVPQAKAVVVPNGIRVMPRQVASVDCREQLLRTLGLPPSTRLVGTVGRLNWAKDQVNLICAFRRAHEHQPDTALLLIGDGELRDELRRCAQVEGVADCVHFLGDRDDVRELLRGLDVFVLSSLSEGYSMALLEACAAALPIVATRVGGNGEILRDNVTGRLVPPSDPASLATALSELLQHPEQAQRLGQAARTWVVAHGSLQSMAAQYAKLYQGTGT